jgi:hypothetical protein
MGMLEPRRPTVDWFCFDDRASSTGASSTGTCSYSYPNAYTSAAPYAGPNTDPNSNTQSNSNSHSYPNTSSTKRSKNFTSCFIFGPRCYYRKTIW